MLADGCGLPMAGSMYGPAASFEMRNVMPSGSYAHPIIKAGTYWLDVPAETWAHQVLTPWQQAAAPLVVKLPEGTATDAQRTVIRNSPTYGSAWEK